MITHRFHLEKKPRSGRKQKYICPGCGKRSFTRYVDDEGIVDFPETVGICDHVNSCGYHYPPKEYFRANPEARKQLSEKAPFMRATPVQSFAPPFSKIDHCLMEGSLTDYAKNPLYCFLRKIVPENSLSTTFRLYNVGTSPKWGGATIFWQVDGLGRVRTGKVMQYDINTGHRIKTYRGGQISWMHTELKIPDFNLRQSLFGEHLLSRFPEKRVMIVESEKTALIASLAFPSYLWLATGGMYNLQPSRCRCLRGRDVVLMPDLGAEDRWAEKARDLRSICHSITVSRTLSEMASPDQRTAGLDLADFLLANPSLLLQSSS